jgi:uncharacterized membrane protein YfcA
MYVSTTRVIERHCTMKRAVTLLMIALTAGTVSAQQQTAPDRTREIRSAERKILVGLAFVGAGAVMIPITTAVSHDAPQEPVAMSGVGLMAAGSALMWYGARDRRKAMRPRTTFGLMLGNNGRAVQVQRRW